MKQGHALRDVFVGLNATGSHSEGSGEGRQSFGWMAGWHDMMPISCRVTPLPMVALSLDLAWKNFIYLLDYLRDIMLQDAAVLQQQFPLCWPTRAGALR